ncbi:MAG: hypothetical protein IH840_08715 [Candidatus Heimdallarchaeota archaeon]|nr:hypothetical protein [Candidatus Heimdallarchaeota archaeon]
MQPKLQPFRLLRRFGQSLKDWVIPDADQTAAEEIVIDEKVVAKAFDLQKHTNYSHHYFSRLKTYKPSLMVERIYPVHHGHACIYIVPLSPDRESTIQGSRNILSKVLSFTILVLI